VRFVFHYPFTDGTAADMLDAGPLVEVARVGERSGFYGMALTEHPVPDAAWLASGGHQTLDPFVAFGAVAGATERLRLITHLCVAPYRNPFMLAKAAATLDRLSGGRFVLGIGTGYLDTEFDALGVDIEERNALFDEALEVLPLHWSGQPFSFRGRHFDAREVIALPKPVQDPIPIWIGGNSRLSRQRAAERAQGWMPLSGAPPGMSIRTPQIAALADLAEMITEMRQAAADAGRSEVIEVIYAYYSPSFTSPAEDADGHREAMAEMEKAGVTLILITPPTNTPPATFEFLEAFGATYIA
jgi:probable F420-dependent oxidoreductase